MGNQGEDGWFPVCLVCGLGNAGCVVCLDPTCHEQREGRTIEGAKEVGAVPRGSLTLMVCHGILR